MKKIIAIIACLALVLSLCACGEKEEKTTLTVFAAASLQETLTQIGEAYMAQHGDVEVVFNFDSSGTLKTQIQEGAVCDVFISAGQKQMNQLDITASAEVNTEELDFVQEGSRFNILENKVTLCVPEGNPKGVESFEGMADALQKGALFMAVGNSDVPVGQYTQKILSYFGLDEAALTAKGCLTYGSNAKEVTTQVREAAVDCGIIYYTDAFSAGLTVVDNASAEMCGQVIYPAAIMKCAVYPKTAQSFLDFCVTEESMAVFEAMGFSPAA